jgi:hypothetical protein
MEKIISVNTKEIKSIVDMIRDADKKELLIVSLFILPIMLGAWSILLNSLTFLDLHDTLKFWIISALAVIYIFGLICMKLFDTIEDKLKRARFHVETRLKKRGGRASYDAIRKEVNPEYSDDFLEKLIETLIALAPIVMV